MECVECVYRVILHSEEYRQNGVSIDNIYIYRIGYFYNECMECVERVKCVVLYLILYMYHFVNIYIL